MELLSPVVPAGGHTGTLQSQMRGIRGLGPGPCPTGECEDGCLRGERERTQYRDARTPLGFQVEGFGRTSCRSSRSGAHARAQPRYNENRAVERRRLGLILSYDFAILQPPALWDGQTQQGGLPDWMTPEPHESIDRPAVAANRLPSVDPRARR
eukprot:CAMPEP_0174318628 /NCGR_PEP_ID=MMETSP0810-20121108/8334_1 /TAXON_ID=73025 ORGANISM="Eutreptiella gymnastica-like, Strain CCMP1594" /NCGR_SAMPLE_ID=MMETSP0810 /ASSEMBLY_ACC=CAM_ASM_000659 /LENGTH=153 /DNA_ID=CAMNT_0015428919 /DNA_START=1531 /DNA_END=1989 /DNA_ORIENTATION=+